jgi:NAD(P)-dependent dehydrogenase (short-subunit alcohol dehydrogenase family)
LLQIAPAGRAVFLTTELARAPRAYWGAYGATKAGLEHLVKSWAAEASDGNWRVNLCDPGVMATRLRAQAMPGEDASSLRRPVDVAPGIARLCLPEEQRQGQIISVNLSE